MKRIITVLLVTMIAIQPAHACCPAGPPGVEVNIADQEIIVVWDANSRMEHFIRRATFKTGAEDFGFLVPTPNMPDLGEEDDALFSSLSDLTRPEIRYEKRYHLGPPLLLLAAIGTHMAPADSMATKSLGRGVTVLLEKRVAGYDAVVLEATDAKALERWLEEHGYATRPQLAEWLRPYVDARWKVTAFRHAADGAAEGVETKAVRMSFVTDRPVFPYRVPTDQLSKVTGGGLLRTFFVGTERVDGILGAEASPWPAKTLYSAPKEQLPEILGHMAPRMNGEDVPWMTVFEDDTWPGGTEDLFFIPAADRSRIEPPPIIRYDDVTIPIPGEFLLLAGFLWWRHSRKKAAELENR